MKKEYNEKALWDLVGPAFFAMYFDLPKVINDGAAMDEIRDIINKMKNEGKINEALVVADYVGYVMAMIVETIKLATTHYCNTMGNPGAIDAMLHQFKSELGMIKHNLN